MSAHDVCPNCGSLGMSIFYEVADVPVHSVILLPTHAAALDYPKGSISLGFCRSCNFIGNQAFDPGLSDYFGDYESTQSHSHLFNRFHGRLANDLITRYGLRGRTVIEIGCGQGEFLFLLCELGKNHGIGFDPAYDLRRSRFETDGRVTFIKDFYSEKYADYTADFICCKMTLEHIRDTAKFVKAVRASIGNRPEVVVFFQVPNGTCVLQDVAFWDVYYEHCSYFSPESLAFLFSASGFDVTDMRTDYDDQYLMIEARPKLGSGPPAAAPPTGSQDMEAAVGRFAETCQRRIADWRRWLEARRRDGHRVAVWGGGSKAVAFLTTLGVRDEVAYAIDINPHKDGTYLAGTGHRVVTPTSMLKERPDVVIVMNPIYRNEIRQQLAALGIDAELQLVTAIT